MLIDCRQPVGQPIGRWARLWLSNGPAAREVSGRRRYRGHFAVHLL